MNDTVQDLKEYYIGLSTWGEDLSNPKYKDKIVPGKPILENLNKSKYFFNEGECLESILSIDAIKEKLYKDKEFYTMILLPESWQDKWGRELFDQLKRELEETNHDVIIVPNLGEYNLENLEAKVYFDIIENVSRRLGIDYNDMDINDILKESMLKEIVVDCSRGANHVNICMFEAAKRLGVRYSILKYSKDIDKYEKVKIKIYYANQKNGKNDFEFYELEAPYKIFFSYPKLLKNNNGKERQLISEIKNEDSGNLLDATYKEIKIYFNSFIIAPIFYFVYFDLDKLGYETPKNKIIENIPKCYKLIVNKNKEKPISIKMCDFDICLSYGKLLLKLYNQLNPKKYIKIEYNPHKNISVGDGKTTLILLCLNKYCEDTLHNNHVIKHYEKFLENIGHHVKEMVFNELSKFYKWSKNYNELKNSKKNKEIKGPSKILLIIRLDDNSEEKFLELNPDTFNEKYKNKENEVKKRNFIAHAGLVLHLAVFFIDIKDSKHKYIGYVENIKNEKELKLETKNFIEKLLKNIDI